VWHGGLLVKLMEEVVGAEEAVVGKER